VLPAASRLRRRPDFAAVVRHGRRAGRPRLVVHLDLSETSGDAGLTPARAGFVVGRAVGGAVARNRVRRQLRHLVAERLPALPPGSKLVVRALPSAAGQTAAALAFDLDAALSRARRSALDRAREVGS